jgi:hypothetical protein
VRFITASLLAGGWLAAAGIERFMIRHAKTSPAQGEAEIQRRVPPSTDA